MRNMVFTIGHSNHDIQVFIGLLRRHDLTALVDVRSHPYSRYVPQYSREALKEELTKSGISYVFLGKELGVRSDNPACYRMGKVQYDLLAKEPGFAEGIRRIFQGMERYRVALMCAEKDPLNCHRALLVARTLYEQGVAVSHIHADGRLESHQDLESRLLATCKLPEGDLFKDRSQFVCEAYTIQGARVAYQDDAKEQVEETAAL